MVAETAPGGRVEELEEDAEVLGRELEAAPAEESVEAFALPGFGGSAKPAPASMRTTASKKGNLDGKVGRLRTMIASSLEETRHVLAIVQ